MINVSSVSWLTKIHVTLARERGDQVQVVHVQMMDTTTHLFWPIPQPGIANHVQITNAFNVRTQTKTHAMYARGQDARLPTAHVQLMDTTMRLFWPILQLGIAKRVQMINANSVSWLTKIHVTRAKGLDDQVQVVCVQMMDTTMHLFSLIPQHGIANPVRMINANSAS